MAQSNFEERIDTYEIESTNVMTGDRDRSRYLYYQLKMSMAKAKQIDIIVSFLMESGVRMFLNDMKRALERGVKIRILTGNYLGITQPSALYLIKSELSDRVDLRLYNETSRSFHPKSYIFHYESSNEIYIGSSNISKSALTSGIEWNYRFSDTLDKKNYELFYATFEDLFLNHSIIIDDEELKRYSKVWKKPAVSKDLAKYDATEDGEDRNAENVRMLYRPRGAQIEALYALQESRMEGAAKGLVYAATGIGKTYLSLFVGYWHQLYRKNRNVMVYVGKWGDVKQEGSNVARYTKFIGKNRTQVVNLATVRIKEEQDFMDNMLIKYVEVLHDLDLIENQFYSRIKYGTDDESAICLIKNGLSLSSATLLIKKYSDYLQINLLESTVTYDENIILKMNERAENEIQIYEVQNCM